MNDDLKFETHMNMLEDETIDNEVKLLLIFELFKNGSIGINTALEFCTKLGLFSEHWAVLDAKATEIFKKRYNKGKP